MEWKYFVLNNKKDNIGKFNAKAGEGLFLGYFAFSKHFRIFNKGNLSIEESCHVTFYETNAKSVEIDVLDFACILEKNIFRR